MAIRKGRALKGRPQGNYSKMTSSKMASQTGPSYNDVRLALNPRWQHSGSFSASALMQTLESPPNLVVDHNNCVGTMLKYTKD